MAVEKQWWAPVWKGLVMDPQARHYRSMKQAIWLFLYLLLNANRKTGWLVRKVRTICADMGIGRETVFRWLKTLRDGGYISTKNTGRCLHIRIEKWKPLSGTGKALLQRSQGPDSRGVEQVISDRLKKAPEDGNMSSIPPVGQNSKKKSVTKSILNNYIEYGNNRQSTPEYSSFVPTTRQELLALDLAKGLGDPDGLGLYLAFADKHSESVLRRVLAEIRELPADKIKRSRGALFNHIIQKHAHTSHHTRP